MKEQKEFAERMRAARELAGLSQGQTAKLLNFHRPTISEIEAGRRKVKTDELEQFAKLYGVEISWLVNGQVSEEKINKKILAAARELSSMKDEDLETLMSTIKMIKSKSKQDEKN